jgi:aminoglycoside phosphotransferase family enzyme
VQHTHRLAPDVYLGVVPVTRRGIQVEAEGKCEVVEWAVKMRRLPDDGSKTSEFEIG